MTELLYFANPMCSWCWGFAPALRALRERHPDLPVTVATGSLGAERARPMSEADRAYVREHWRKVQARSGQPFDFTFFERRDFVYDTEPPCRALALLRRRYPALAAPFLDRLQELFYAHNEDITDTATLRRVCGEFGIPPEAFDAAFGAPELVEEVRREWAQTARLGVTGFPTLLALAGGRAHVLTVGWCDPGELLRRFAGLEQERRPTAP